MYILLHTLITLLLMLFKHFDDYFIGNFSFVDLDMTCDKPTNLPLHSFLIGEDVAFGLSLTLMCDRGYRLDSHSVSATNQSKITCTREQTWKPDVKSFKCLRKSYVQTIRRPKISYTLLWLINALAFNSWSNNMNKEPSLCYYWPYLEHITFTT